MLLTCNTLADTIDWAAPDFQLRAGVAIFRLPVAENRPFAPRAAAVLQTAERQRAQRYHRAEDYYRFVLGRAAQRLVLGAYLGQPAASLHFEPGANRKPRLREPSALHYNVAHAGNWVLLAVAAAEIGIDVERLDPLFAFREVLETSCSPAEQAFIDRRAAPHRAFYQLWTRKEALVKGTGQGIDATFSQVPALDGTHQLPGPGPALGWVVSSFEAAAGYAAAVAHPAALAGALRFYDLGSELLGELAQRLG